MFMQIGDKVSSMLDLQPPMLLFFVSNFCSKCLTNRKIINQHIDQEKIQEINIADQGPILEELQPRMAPTHVVIGGDRQILHISEGIISERTVLLIKKLLIS